MKTIVSLVSTLATFAMSSAMAQTTYTDTVGTDHYGGADADIISAVINNDANNITFQVNLNTADNITTAYFDHYELGLQMGSGAGGQTSTVFTGSDFSGPTATNPYGNSVGISTGVNFWIGTFINSGGASGGAQLYSYSSTTGWSQIGANAPLTIFPTGTPSIAFSFSLASLGLNAGDSFKFDVWSTFGSPQGAYDALDNPNTPPGTAPYSGGSYDSATAAGSTLATYTVQAVPEPGTYALFGLGALGMVGRVLRRNAR